MNPKLLTKPYITYRDIQNLKSRQRTVTARQRIESILKKPACRRSIKEEEELQADLAKKRRKCEYAKARVIEKRERLKAILAKPESQRTIFEKEYLETQTARKKRKNEGDRLRRSRIKKLAPMLGEKAAKKSNIPARGPLPPQVCNAIQQRIADLADL